MYMFTKTKLKSFTKIHLCQKKWQNSQGNVIHITHLLTSVEACIGGRVPVSCIPRSKLENIQYPFK